MLAENGCLMNTWLDKQPEENFQYMWYFSFNASRILTLSFATLLHLSPGWFLTKLKACGTQYLVKSVFLKECVKSYTTISEV